MKSRDEAELFANALKKQFGEELVSVVLFGSVARGEERENSDIDLLVILKALPAGRYIRQALLDPIYEEWSSQGLSCQVNCLLKTPLEAEKMTVFYLDFPEEAKLLFDQNSFFANILGRVSELIQERGFTRKKWGKFYYWDLKPGASAEEIFEIL